MQLIKGVRSRFAGMMNASVHRKSFNLKLETGVISFTFDDFPRTSYTVAGKILKSKEMLGTYYASFGLMGQASEYGDLFLEEDLRGLLHDGHELGCHTYSHIDCRNLDGPGLSEEIDRNNSAFAPYLTQGGQASGLVHFAYPIGGVTRATKQVVKRHFTSGRGIRTGINSGVIDLAFLRASRLYSHATPLESILELIERNDRERGWLILYTHDVSETPSDFGCTPTYFESVVRAAALSSGRVLNVRDAFKVFATQP